MANTAAVYARIDPTLKKEVDAILDKLNVTPSALIQMLYGQIKLNNGIPFEIKIPSQPIFVDELSKEELDSEIQKGQKDIENGKVHSVKEGDDILSEMKK